MAEETVSYRAKSVFTSKTIWINIVAALVAYLGSTEFTKVLGADTPEWYAGLFALLNIGLRFVTVRPVAIVAPGESKPVPVPKLA